MSQLKVLIVDDSAAMRKKVRGLLEQDSSFEVIGIARNGKDAVEKIERLKPDVVTMDIEMPEMDGITALKKVMHNSPTPIIMLSSVSNNDSKESIRSLESGAVDFFLKDELFDAPQQEIIDNFLTRLKVASAAKLNVVEMKHDNLKESEVEIKPKLVMESDGKVDVELIIIGSSTGGPSALQAVLPYFTADFPIPIIVAQHMPPGFTKPLATRFNMNCHLRVKEAEDGDMLTTGNVYIAPAGYQTIVKRDLDGQLKIQIQPSNKELYKPSVDITLQSAAPLVKGRLLVAVLTGMGVDGREGCMLVKQYNGKVIVEAEESCVVYGMPKAIYEAGYADAQTPIHNMYSKIMSFC